jgi:hypothetical protein
MLCLDEKGWDTNERNIHRGHVVGYHKCKHIFTGIKHRKNLKKNLRLSQLNQFIKGRYYGNHIQNIKVGLVMVLERQKLSQMRECKLFRKQKLVQRCQSFRDFWQKESLEW